MAEILKISETQVKIGTDDGKVVTVPIASIAFADPREGDKVNIYKDGSAYIVKRAGGAPIASEDSDGVRRVNKHIFVWVANFLFGGLGVDRFMRGQVGLGIVKLLFGWLTFGIWPLVDWIISLAKAYGSSYSDTEDLTFDRSGNYMR